MAGRIPRCGACKYHSRSCAKDCLFAPYFGHTEGEAHFITIHRVFGSKNFSRFLLELPPSDRGNAVMSFLYEARIRLDDPKLGCVREIMNLQQQVETLQAQVATLQAQVATLQAAQNTILSTFTTPVVANEGMQYQSTSLQPQPIVPPSTIIPPEGNAGVEEQNDLTDEQIDDLYNRLFGSSSS